MTAPIPQITVNVVPQIDEAALAQHVREAAAQVLEAVAASLRGDAPAQAEPEPDPASVLPAEITTPEELALAWPNGTTIRDDDGDTWTLRDGGWYCEGDTSPSSPRGYLPARVLGLG